MARELTFEEKLADAQIRLAQIGWAANFSRHYPEKRRLYLHRVGGKLLRRERMIKKKTKAIFEMRLHWKTLVGDLRF